MIEAETGRALLNTTRDYWQEDWPSGDSISLPYSPVSSVTGVYWKGTTGAETTLTVTTDYIADTDSDPGRIVLPYNGTWPSSSLYPVNPVRVRYVCGYGAAASSVPTPLKQAVLLTVGDLYEHRESFVIGKEAHPLPIAAKWLCAPYKLWLSPATSNA